MPPRSKPAFSAFLCPIPRTLWLAGAMLLASCDHGLTPPDTPPSGTLRAVITYTGAWPPSEALQDLRFVAMTFVPRDTADILDLRRIVFSPTPLAFNVSSDTVVLSDVKTGTYVYSGVAQRYSQSFVDWRPVGLVEANGGVFHVRAGETTNVSVDVDFAHPPLFPPVLP